MRTLLAVPAISALLLASACGGSAGDDDDASPTTPTAPTTEPVTTALAVEDWAAGFCAEFDRWSTELRTTSDAVADQIAQGDAEGAQEVYRDLFAQASELTGDLISALEAGGTPDIDDGQGLVDDLMERFRSIDDAAQEAQRGIVELDTDDPAAFKAEADELASRYQSTLGEISDSFEQIDVDHPSPELQAALDASCDL